MTNPNQPRPYPNSNHHAPQANPPPTKNPLGIAALALAVVGTVFAVWEGAYIIGWILLPIAGILAIVALVQRGREKKFAAAGLVISIIGGIAGGVAFTMSVNRAFEDAFGSSTVTAAPPTAAEEATAGETTTAESGDAAEPPADANGAAEGTRANPYPLGTTLVGDEWELTVNSYNPDATADVLAENPFNEPPAEGNVYSLANVTITYTGDSSGTSFEISVAYVSAGGNVINSYDNMAVAPDGLGLDELYNGASTSGNVIFEVAAGDDGLLRVQPGLFADEVFVAIR